MLVLAFLSSSSVNAQTKITTAWFTFTIKKAGQPGTLTFCQIIDSVIVMPIDWSANSGDNDPAHQTQANVGPIPEGKWDVYPQDSQNPDGTTPTGPGQYPIYWVDVPNRNNRNGFYIHRFVSVSKGCISLLVDDAGWTNFCNIVNEWFTARGFKTIPLTVSYSVGGVIVLVDKLALLAPYFGLASTILVATAATAIYVKRVKHRKDKQ
jgi:hypothetical protein